MHINCDVINFTSKYVILRNPTVAIFADIIKITTIFIKKISQQDSHQVKRTRNYVSICNLYLHFLILKNLLISDKKC